MNLFKRVLVPVLFILILAGAAFASANPWGTGHRSHLTMRFSTGAPMTRDQYRDFYNSRHAATSATQAPNHHNLRTTPPAGKGLAPKADPRYALAELLYFPGYLGGIGVGEVGDYVLFNTEDWDDLYAYKNGHVTYLGEPGYDGLAGGRMLGQYYFGDWGGDLFRLENDLTITFLGGPGDDWLEVGGVAIEPVTGDVYFAVNDWYDFPFYGQVDFWRYSPSQDYFYYIDYAEYEFSWGLAIKGNYLYISFAYDDEIWKWNYKKDGPPVLFTDKTISPYDIQFDAKDNLYVAEYEPGDIVRFNATATSRTKIAWNLYGPMYLGLDKAGDIFFDDYDGNIWKLRKK